MSAENINLIGITERGDAALDLSWEDWVFKQRRPAILISKDPCKLYYAIAEMTAKYNFTPNVIVHCTITGLGGSKIEPNVPKPANALVGYSDFVKMLGKDRVVLRCDPIIPTTAFVSHALKNVMMHHLETRIRFSFLDIYPHVKQRLESASLDWHKLGFKDEKLHASKEDRFFFVTDMQSALSDKTLLQACGEPGIESAPCVSEFDCKTLGVQYMAPAFHQRFACNCAANKTELLKMKGRCKHGCLYCYWKDQKDYFSGK